MVPFALIASAMKVDFLLTFVVLCPAVLCATLPHLTQSGTSLDNNWDVSNIAAISLHRAKRSEDERLFGHRSMALPLKGKNIINVYVRDFIAAKIKHLKRLLQLIDSGAGLLDKRVLNAVAEFLRDILAVKLALINYKLTLLNLGKDKGRTPKRSLKQIGFFNSYKGPETDKTRAGHDAFPDYRSGAPPKQIGFFNSVNGPGTDRTIGGRQQTHNRPGAHQTPSYVQHLDTDMSRVTLEMIQANDIELRKLLRGTILQLNQVYTCAVEEGARVARPYSLKLQKLAEVFRTINTLHHLEPPGQANALRVSRLLEVADGILTFIKRMIVGCSGMLGVHGGMRRASIYAVPKQPAVYAVPKQPAVYAVPKEPAVYAVPKDPVVYAVPKEPVIYAVPKQPEVVAVPRTGYNAYPRQAIVAVPKEPTIVAVPKQPALVAVPKQPTVVAVPNPYYPYYPGYYPYYRQSGARPVIGVRPKTPVVSARPKQPVVVAKPKTPVVVATPKDRYYG